MKPTRIAFERRYADDSGVEYAVRLDNQEGVIEIEHVDTIDIPSSEVDWLIDALNAVRREIPEPPKIQPTAWLPRPPRRYPIEVLAFIHLDDFDLKGRREWTTIK